MSNAIARRALFAAPALLLTWRPALADIVFVPKSGSLASGIAVATAGSASVTGTTSETLLASLKIPANSMGKNGVVQLAALLTYTNSTNNKSLGIRFGSAAGILGGVIGTVGVTTTASSQFLTIIRNNNATNLQTVFPPSPLTPFGTANSAPNAPAVDTTADVYINLTGTLALSTETLTLVHAFAVVFPAP